MRAQQSFLAPLFRGNFKAAAARRFTRTRSVWTASTSSSSPSPFTVNKSINPTTNNNVNTPTQQPLYINTRSHSSSSSLFSSHSPVNSQLSTLLTQTASRFISHTSSPHHRDSNDRSDSHNGDFASRSPYAMKASSKSKSRQPSFVNNLNSTHRARELRKKESFLQQLVVKREEEDNLANYEGTDATCVEFALLVNRGKFDEAYKMFELHGDDFPAALWNIMLSRLYTMKRYDEAISVFRDMRSKGLANELSYYYGMQSVDAKEKHPEAALDAMLKDMQSDGIQPGSRILGVFFLASCRSKNVQQAEMYYQFFKEKELQVPLDCMHAMMHMFSQIGDQERVIELYNSIRDNGQPLNILIFNTLIYAFARRAEIDKMIYCYDEMLSMGITPNEHVLRTLMEGFGRKCHSNFNQGFCKETAINMMIQYFEECTTEHGVRPNYQIFKTIIFALKVAGHTNYVEFFFDEMIKFGIQPDRDIFNYILHSYSSLPMGSGTLKMKRILAMMGQAPYYIDPDNFTYHTIIKAAGVGRQWEDMIHTYRLMQAEGHQPHYCTYNVIVSRMMGSGIKTNIDMALEVYQDAVGRPEMKLDVAGLQMLKGLAKKEMVNEMMHVYEVSKDRMQLDASMFNMMMAAVVLRNNYDTSNKLEYLQSEMERYGVVPNTYIFHTLMRGFSNADNIKSMSDVYALTREHRQQHSKRLFNLMVVSMLRTGAYAEASKVLREMRRLFIEPTNTIANALHMYRPRRGYNHQYLEVVYAKMQGRFDFSNVQKVDVFALRKEKKKQRIREARREKSRQKRREWKMKKLGDKPGEKHGQLTAAPASSSSFASSSPLSSAKSSGDNATVMTSENKKPEDNVFVTMRDDGDAGATKEDVTESLKDDGGHRNRKQRDRIAARVNNKGLSKRSSNTAVAARDDTEVVTYALNPQKDLEEMLQGKVPSSDMAEYCDDVFSESLSSPPTLSAPPALSSSSTPGSEDARVGSQPQNMSTQSFYELTLRDSLVRDLDLDNNPDFVEIDSFQYPLNASGIGMGIGNIRAGLNSTDDAGANADSVVSVDNGDTTGKSLTQRKRRFRYIGQMELGCSPLTQARRRASEQSRARASEAGSASSSSSSSSSPSDMSTIRQSLVSRYLRSKVDKISSNLGRLDKLRQNKGEAAAVSRLDHLKSLGVEKMINRDQ